MGNRVENWCRIVSEILSKPEDHFNPDVFKPHQVTGEGSTGQYAVTADINGKVARVILRADGEPNKMGRFIVEEPDDKDASRNASSLCVSGFARFPDDSASSLICNGHAVIGSGRYQVRAEMEFPCNERESPTCVSLVCQARDPSQFVQKKLAENLVYALVNGAALRIDSISTMDRGDGDSDAVVHSFVTSATGDGMRAEASMLVPDPDPQNPRRAVNSDRRVLIPELKFVLTPEQVIAVLKRRINEILGVKACEVA